jgi:hypothetical protein
MRAELGLQLEELRLEIGLEGELVLGVPLVPAAGAVLPPELAEGVEVRVDHEPARTARTKLRKPLLLPASPKPALKDTRQAK